MYVLKISKFICHKITTNMHSSHNTWQGMTNYAYTGQCFSGSAFKPDLEIRYRINVTEIVANGQFRKIATFMKCTRNSKPYHQHLYENMSCTKPFYGVMHISLNKQSSPTSCSVYSIVVNEDFWTNGWAMIVSKLRVKQHIDSVVKLGGSRRISDLAPLFQDPLALITDPVPHNWDPAPFLLGSTILLGRIHASNTI